MTELSAKKDTPRRVLLVEDSMALSVLYQQYVMQAGYGVTAVTSGEGALEALAEEHAAVALDLGLPDMDGLDILKTHTVAGAPPPWWSSPAMPPSAARSRRCALGAFDYLVKPITAERLATTLRNALEFRALKRKVAAYQQEQARQFRRLHRFVAADAGDL